MKIKVLDLFSGPGGLGEGFASLHDGQRFEIAISAEMESSAHTTLTMRAFFRLARNAGDQKALSAYYDFCNFVSAPHPSQSCANLWKRAASEARQLTLGQPSGNQILDGLIDDKRLRPDKTVLIGGPPCQAYSLVGRARNKGKAGYLAENDHRHFLYREYLRILARTNPAVFVMENVKGILTSSVGGRQIFDDILVDLRNPHRAIGKVMGPRYVIHSLTTDSSFQIGMDPGDVRANDYIVRSELFGIPQARHRVILLGVREDIAHKKPLLRECDRFSVRDAIGDLPALRSRLSTGDSPDAWQSTVSSQGENLARDAKKHRLNDLSTKLREASDAVSSNLPVGGLRMEKSKQPDIKKTSNSFEKWVKDRRLKVWLNHEARSHMKSDLGRYLYAAIFTQLHDRSPKGHGEFLLEGLEPAHANWRSGKFSDRFRVQRAGAASTTITSHIAKDGHYFIHPDPLQCRSLTVREAARLQSFPDNYFFQGNRTQQYHQVGNAVPPLLASQIADVVSCILD